jgi:16S rRNA (cytidine1402-2'-O)-methyltransferase
MSKTRERGSTRDSQEAGRLYVIATPIGNLGDITYRAVEILKQVPVIGCEDTRRVRSLLAHLQIPAPKLLSYHDHNEVQRTSHLISILEAGEDVAIVSDAGTPTISDPGYRVVREAGLCGIQVIPLPGPCAAVTGLAASGLPTDRYIFLGFPPVKQGKLDNMLEQALEPGRTSVMYVPMRRIPKLLGLIQIKAPVAEVVIGRELTKLHEEFIRGTAGELIENLDRISLKGECTLIMHNPKVAKRKKDYSKAKK